MPLNERPNTALVQSSDPADEQAGGGLSWHGCSLQGNQYGMTENRGSRVPGRWLALRAAPVTRSLLYF